MKKILLISLLWLTNTQVYSENLEIEEIEFISHSDRLSGSIVFPKNHPPHSAVVFVHGSGKESRNLNLAKRFASEGIVALGYDKRGVGNSEGQYEWKKNTGEKNLNLLADDANAAINVLNEHPITKNLPIGLTGASQAGWIVPLAAVNNRSVDFIALWSGPVCKVSEEILFSNYTSDQDTNKAIAFDEVLKSESANQVWPKSLGKDTDPSESLGELKIPGIWVFGEYDGSIPVDLSIKRLKALIELGHEYEYVLFSNLGHNNAEESFTTVTEWIKRVRPSS